MRRREKEEVREPCIDLRCHLDTFRRHFLIAMVVIIKDRTPGRVYCKVKERETQTHL